MNGSQPDPDDLRLLEILQDGIPIISNPWQEIAGRLGMSDDEVIRRVTRLTGERIILGISPVIEPRRLGLTAATLVALRVPDDRVDETAAIISSYREVSHNFRRDHAYPIWFTLTAQTGEQLGAVLADILRRTGTSPDDILNLPTVRKLKIDLRFPISSQKRSEVSSHG